YAASEPANRTGRQSRHCVNGAQQDIVCAKLARFQKERKLTRVLGNAKAGAEFRFRQCPHLANAKCPNDCPAGLAARTGKPCDTKVDKPGGNEGENAFGAARSFKGAMCRLGTLDIIGTCGSGDGKRTA